MADEATENQPVPVIERGPAAVSSVRWSAREKAEQFKKVVAWRIAKGKSKSESHFIEQMFDYVKKNPYSDFPTGL